MIGAVVRFIVSAIVLLIVSFLIPGFHLSGFINALLAALLIAVVGFVMEKIFGGEITPHARGIIGFLVSAVVIYLVQFFIPTMQVSIMGAILASIIIGIADIFVPTELR